jgi:hypothetical protein
MANTIVFGRYDGGVDTITPVGTTLAGAPVLTGAVNLCAAAAGQVSVALPQGGSGPVVVLNTAATAVALTVFPPTAAGKIFVAAAPSAGAAFSQAQNKAATYFPHPNGIDYTVVPGA